MRSSCIDCEEFPTCRKCTSAWCRAWKEYPPSAVKEVSADNLEKRLNLMQVQYSICHEKQMTFQTLKRPERAF